jgi:hypothetical protein
LRYPGNVIIAAANEPDKRFPWVLPQYAHASELGGLLLEVRIRRRPLFIQRRELGLEIEIVSDKRRCIRVFGIMLHRIIVPS